MQVCVYTIYRVDVSARTYHLKSRFIFCQIPFNVVCIYKERNSQFDSIHSYCLTVGISHDCNN